MKTLTFAVGLAAGYVLGTRAGRERYEQIVQSARKAANHPTVVQAQNKAKDLINAGTDAARLKMDSDVPDTLSDSSLDSVPPRPARRRTTPPVLDVTDNPLA